MQTVSETFAGTITVNRQMRLALPRMAMSLLIMSYLVADGVLISRFVGTTALSALSMSYPLTALLIAAGFMIAAGGGAVAARALGAQKHEEALRAFSTALTTNIMLGLTLGLLASRPSRLNLPATISACCSRRHRFSSQPRPLKSSTPLPAAPKPD